MTIEVDDNWHHKKLTELFQHVHIQRRAPDQIICHLSIMKRINEKEAFT